MEKSPICTWNSIFSRTWQKSIFYVPHKKSNSGGFWFLYNVCLDYGSNDIAYALFVKQSC